MAEGAKSIRGTYLFGKETSYGTGGTANKDIGLVQNFSLNPEVNAEDELGAGSAKAIGAKSGIVTPKGSIEYKLQHGRPIEWAMFGGVTTHAATTGDETHTFVWDDMLPTLAYEAMYKQKSGTDLGFVGTGLLFGSTTFSTSLDAMLIGRSDFTAKTIDMSDTTASAAVVNTGLPWAGFQASASINSVTPDFIQGWELTMNANSKVLHGAGARGPTDGSSHGRQVSFRVNVGFSSAAQFALATGSAAAITATEPTSFPVVLSTDNGVALGSGKRATTFNLTGCQMKSPNVTAQINDFVMATWEGVGVLSSATAVDQVLSAAW